jgi:hypothetical protein
MNLYAINEEEFNELERTMRLVDLVDTAAQSESGADVTQAQLGAFTSIVVDKLRALVKGIEARYSAAESLPKVEGLKPWDVVEIIQLLAGQRFVPVSRWKEIEGDLARCAQVDESMSYALTAWQSAMEVETLALIDGDPTLRFNHLTHEPLVPRASACATKHRAPVKGRARGASA